MEMEEMSSETDKIFEPCYTQEIRDMMYIFGDVEEPLLESAFLIEEILRHQINALLIKITKHYEEAEIKRKLAKIDFQDLLQLLMNNKVKLRRLLDYLVKVDRAECISKKSFQKLKQITECPWKGTKIKSCLGYFRSVNSDYAQIMKEQIEDTEMQQRLQMRDKRAMEMDPTSYIKVFSEKMHTSFCPQQKILKFKNWILKDKVTSFDLSRFTVKIINYLARESVAKIVELTLAVRTKKPLPRWQVCSLEIHDNPSISESQNEDQETKPVSRTPQNISTESQPLTDTKLQSEQENKHIVTITTATTSISDYVSDSEQPKVDINISQKRKKFNSASCTIKTKKPRHLSEGNASPKPEKDSTLNPSKSPAGKQNFHEANNLKCENSKIASKSNITKSKNAVINSSLVELDNDCEVNLLKMTFYHFGLTPKLLGTIKGEDKKVRDCFSRCCKIPEMFDQVLSEPSEPPNSPAHITTKHTESKDQSPQKQNETFIHERVSSEDEKPTKSNNTPIQDTTKDTKSPSEITPAQNTDPELKSVKSEKCAVTEISKNKINQEKDLKRKIRSKVKHDQVSDCEINLIDLKMQCFTLPHSSVLNSLKEDMKIGDKEYNFLDEIEEDMGETSNDNPLTPSEIKEAVRLAFQIARDPFYENPRKFFSHRFLFC